MGAKPMTPWEHRDARQVRVPRAVLHDGERWTDDCWVNNRYSVQVSLVSLVATAWGDVTHLWVREHAGGMPRSWSDLQRIKNELTGPERVAVEVFPPVSQLIDSANMAHLWVYPSGFTLPFRLR